MVLTAVNCLKTRISYKYGYETEEFPMLIENDRTLQVVTNIKFIIERLRIVSRTFMTLYICVLAYGLAWATSLPDITSPQSALISALVGMATPLTKFYVDTGKNLYDDHENIMYSSRWVYYFDMFGYFLDKFRIFPVIFVAFFMYSWFDVLMWGMDLGSDLSNQQATFISIYTGAASLVFGFLVTSGDINLKLEKSFMKRQENNQVPQQDSGNP